MFDKERGLVFVITQSQANTAYVSAATTEALIESGAQVGAQVGRARAHWWWAGARAASNRSTAGFCHYLLAIFDCAE